MSDPYHDPVAAQLAACGCWTCRRRLRRRVAGRRRSGDPGGGWERPGEVVPGLRVGGSGGSPPHPPGAAPVPANEVVWVDRAVDVVARGIDAVGVSCLMFFPFAAIALVCSGILLFPIAWVLGGDMVKAETPAGVLGVAMGLVVCVPFGRMVYRSLREE